MQLNNMNRKEREQKIRWGAKDFAIRFYKVMRSLK